MEHFTYFSVDSNQYILIEVSFTKQPLYLIASGLLLLLFFEKVCLFVWLTYQNVYCVSAFAAVHCK